MSTTRSETGAPPPVEILLTRKICHLEMKKKKTYSSFVESLF